MAETIKITTLEQLKIALQAAKTYIDGEINCLGTLAGKSGVAKTPTDKAVDLTIPTGALANKDSVAETDLDAALKEKVNAAAEGNHSHANKAFLDTLSGATDAEITAMCTEVFGA